MAAIYIHIPFCQSKCAYCDFASFAGWERDQAHYLSALHREILSARAEYADFPVQTVFIGGGTPSMLPGEAISALMEALNSHFSIDPFAEITIEANPGTLTPDQLLSYRRSGINRLSMGAQASQPHLLERLGRIHRWADVAQSVALAKEAGFKNISLDLMYGLPGQTVDDFRETLRAAISLEPEHLSCYSLIVEENTPLYGQLRRGEALLPSEDEAYEMGALARGTLADAGYHRYEISNWARPGRECRHNIGYWQRGDYLGLGSAAHSLIGNHRFENPASLDRYLAGERGINRILLEIDEEREEALLLMTRMPEGIDLAAYASRYHEDLLVARAPAVERLVRAGLVRAGLVRIFSGRLFLTEKGLDLQNAVVLALIGG